MNALILIGSLLAQAPDPVTLSVGDTVDLKAIGRVMCDDASLIDIGTTADQKSLTITGKKPGSTTCNVGIASLPKRVFSLTVREAKPKK